MISGKILSQSRRERRNKEGWTEKEEKEEGGIGEGRKRKGEGDNKEEEEDEEEKAKDVERYISSQTKIPEFIALKYCIFRPTVESQEVRVCAWNHCLGLKPQGAHMSGAPQYCVGF